MLFGVLADSNIKKYILGELQLYSKISTMHKIVSDYVQSLNIDSIIDSYTVSVEEFIRTKVGGDDTYFMTEKAICDYNHSDTYLKKYCLHIQTQHVRADIVLFPICLKKKRKNTS